MSQSVEDTLQLVKFTPNYSVHHQLPFPSAQPESTPLDLTGIVHDLECDMGFWNDKQPTPYGTGG
jgi:hypothetical protein